MYSSPIRQSSYLFTSNIDIVEKNSLLQRSAARSVSQFLFIVSENNETLLLDVKVHFSIFLFLSAANYSQEKLMVFAGELMLMRFELALVASFLLKSRLLQSPMQSAHNGKFPSKRIFFLLHDYFNLGTNIWNSPRVSFFRVVRFTTRSATFGLSRR